MQGTATAYGPPWGGIEGGGTTATGIDLSSAPHKLIVAVDPSVIPLGSKVKVWPNPFGDPNLIFTAADTGGAIKGTHIDFYDWLGRANQNNWGVRPVNIQVVGKGSTTDAAMLGQPGAASSSPTTASSSSGDLASQWGGPLLRGFLEVAFVVAGIALIYYGVRSAAGARGVTLPPRKVLP
jgi:3D (Asp-Asp-Asp) domain-containing protein